MICRLCEVWFRNNLKKHTLALASLKRTITRLNSPISWLREGDANTKLFHLQSHHCKPKNFIAKLVSEDHIFTNHDDKAYLVDQHYDELLGTCLDRKYTINLIVLGAPNYNLSDLELPFTEEVWMTIKKLPYDKAPGPDRLTGRFYKTCWSIIKQDIMIAMTSHP
jgi:hypothetical protein